MKHDPLSKHGIASKGLLMAACFFWSLCEQTVTSVRQKSSEPVDIVPHLITHLSPLCPWQQEQLLLSVLPRYIAMELKTEVIKRLSKPKSKEENESNFNNFHSLYIRQHKDVRWRSDCVVFAVFIHQKLLSWISLSLCGCVQHPVCRHCGVHKAGEHLLTRGAGRCAQQALWQIWWHRQGETLSTFLCHKELFC